MRPVRIVCATQHDEHAFRSMELGKTLPRLIGRWRDLLRTSIVFNNREGLSAVYNQFISDEHAGEIILFTHHDVYLEDYWIVQRLNEALEVYDAVGVLGQSYPFPAVEWDGKVVHWDRGTMAQGVPGDDFYNSQCEQWACSSPGRVYAISGEFIAINTDTVLENGVKFDEAFSQDFYDLDFSRSCTKEGLRLGVWPIVETHNGIGLDSVTKYGSKEMAIAEWNRQKPAYVVKWSK